MRVIKKLAKQFKEPKDTEAHYFPVNVHVTQECMHVVCPTQQTEVHIEQVLNQGQQLVANHSVQDLCLQLLTQLPPDDQLKAISAVFVQFACSDGITGIQEDFLTLCLAAMHHLQKSGCSNIQYNLACGLGSERSDGSDSLFPAKRMPVGLVEHAAAFFISSPWVSYTRTVDIFLYLSHHIFFDRVC